jgi:GNAT superfamily N-acetyltransferase
MGFSSRLATLDDIPVLTPMINRAIVENQRAFLDEAQITLSQEIMGIDHQLIADGTYFVIDEDGVIAGCGGWSRRATLFGGSHSAGRDASLLDPSTQPARVRAMYTDPSFVRRGVGRLILTLCEGAARAEGFTRLELMATAAGRPLYEAFGFVAIEPFEHVKGDVRVPMTRMGKPVADGVVAATFAAWRHETSSTRRTAGG